jgi:hypothetical protein
MITIASRVRPIPVVSAVLLLAAGAAQAVDVGPAAGTKDTPDNANFDSNFEPGGVVFIDDLRLNYGFLPDKATISVLPKNGGFNLINYDKTTNWDKTGRTDITWMTPWSDLDEDGGFLFGIELHTDHYIIEASQVNPSISYRAIAISIDPGIGWTLWEGSQLEITPFAGAGVAMTNYGSGLGTYFELGIRTGLYYTFRSRWQVGINAAWMLSRGRMDLTNNGEKFNARFDTEGLAGALSLGYRFKP